MMQPCTDESCETCERCDSAGALVLAIMSKIDAISERQQMYEYLGYKKLARRWFVAELKLSLFIDESFTLDEYNETLASYDAR